MSDGAPTVTDDQRERPVSAATATPRHSVTDHVTVGGPAQVRVNGHGSRARRTALGTA